MKKFLFVPILFIAGIIHAGDVVSPLKGNPDSFYTVTHSTVAVSSQTVSTDASVTGYRAVYIYNLSQASTVYYYLGTAPSTTTVTGMGWPIFPWKTPTAAGPIPEKIEYNGTINYRLGAGSVGSIDITKKTFSR